jgi:hypothetical protein
MKQVTVFWKVTAARVHALMFAADIYDQCTMTLNGETYLEVTDEQYAVLDEYKQKGWCEFRHKLLVKENGRLRPAETELILTNK